MRALVTGAAGFIGSHLAETLIREGHDVTCLARGTSDLQWIENLHARLHLADLSDIESCLDVLDGQDVIFHVAGLTKGATERDFFEANAGNTEKLLRAVYERNPSVRRFLYISSLSAAGPGRSGMPVREDMVPQPASWYGRSKLAAERIVRQYTGRLPVTILRPTAVYGPRDRDFLVLFRMIRRGLYPYWGQCRYSMIYIDDLVRGMIAAAGDSRAEGETFFLAGEQAHSNQEIIREISEALGVHPLPLPLPRAALHILAFLGRKFGGNGLVISDRINDFRHPFWTCDSGKARHMLGFQVEVPLRQGISWTADWYRIHQWL